MTGTPAALLCSKPWPGDNPGSRQRLRASASVRLAVASTTVLQADHAGTRDRHRADGMLPADPATTVPAVELPVSPRLRFRQMDDGDLELMHSLLGNPVVMAHYDRPKTVEECRCWIGWNKHNYDRDGCGLWIIETLDGDFVGECGLTWQPVEGESLELGYHLKRHFQGKGLATEAAQASKELSCRRGIDVIIAVVASQNAPSARVAEKTGLSLWKHAEVYGQDRLIYRADLTPPKLTRASPERTSSC